MTALDQIATSRPRTNRWRGSCVIVFAVLLSGLEETLSAPLELAQSAPLPQLPGPTLLPPPQVIIPKEPPRGGAKAGPVAPANGAETPPQVPACTAANSFSCYQSQAVAAEREHRLSAALDLYILALDGSDFQELAGAIGTGTRTGPQPEFWTKRGARNQRYMGKIIELAKIVKPEIPAGARHAMDRGLVKATTLQGLKEAKDDFYEAVHLAPWWDTAHNNLSAAWEALGDYTNAVNSLHLYLLSVPSGTDTKAAEDKLRELERKRRSS